MESDQDGKGREVQRKKRIVSGTSSECARSTCKTEIAVRGDQDNDSEERDCDMKEDISCGTESGKCNMEKV